MIPSSCYILKWCSCIQCISIPVCERRLHQLLQLISLWQPIMSNLLQGMGLIKETFFKYSEGKPTMTKRQVVQLLRKEMLEEVVSTTCVTRLKCQNSGCKPNTLCFWLIQNNDEAQKLFDLLDNDGSGTVDFKEFVTFVAAVSVLSC